MEVSISVNTDTARAALSAINNRIDVALRSAMQDANSLLLRQVRDYPAPPDPIQGPANVPVRSFTTRGGQTVRLRANRAIGKGITFQRASTLRYKRTNTLYRSWQPVLRGEGADLTGGVVSSGQIAPYNRYVQDAAYQARIHQGRWDTVQVIGERSTAQINEMFANRIRAATGG
jgi:hypothetical protein